MKQAFKALLLLFPDSLIDVIFEYIGTCVVGDEASDFPDNENKECWDDSFTRNALLAYDDNTDELYVFNHRGLSIVNWSNSCLIEQEICLGFPRYLMKKMEVSKNWIVAETVRDLHIYHKGTRTCVLSLEAPLAWTFLSSNMLCVVRTEVNTQNGILELINIVNLLHSKKDDTNVRLVVDVLREIPQYASLATLKERLICYWDGESISFYDSTPLSLPWKKWTKTRKTSISSSPMCARIYGHGWELFFCYNVSRNGVCFNEGESDARSSCIRHYPVGRLTYSNEFRSKHPIRSLCIVPSLQRVGSCIATSFTDGNALVLWH